MTEKESDRDLQEGTELYKCYRDKSIGKYLKLDADGRTFGKPQRSTGSCGGGGGGEDNRRN